MVRILSGTLPDLESRDRAEAGPTLPARGLTLEKVEYREIL